jgi:hypothetical protein
VTESLEQRCCNDNGQSQANDTKTQYEPEAKGRKLLMLRGCHQSMLRGLKTPMRTVNDRSAKASSECNHPPPE